MIAKHQKRLPKKAWKKHHVLKAISSIKKDYSKKHGCKLHDDHHIARAMVYEDPKCAEIKSKYDALI
jgi:hypothetical protein